MIFFSIKIDKHLSFLDDTTNIPRIFMCDMIHLFVCPPRSTKQNFGYMRTVANPKSQSDPTKKVLHGTVFAKFKYISNKYL